MTRVLYTQDKNTFTLDVKGHAGYSEYGHDIVCAAISMLVHTLVEHMDKVAEDYECRMESGDVWIWAKGKDAVASAKTIMTGFIMLDHNFPEHVRISQRVS